MKQIRVLLAEDLTLVRQGIRSVLNSVPDVEIVGEAANGQDAVRLALELQPQVVLMDQDMPEMDGLEAAGIIKQAMPDVEIIVLTDRLDDQKAMDAIEHGATGYVLKDIAADNLANAVRSVCNGRAFFHPQITRGLMRRLGQSTRKQRVQRGELNGLTPRELDIVLALAKGSTDNEIAADLVLASGTIKTHVRHILRKLHCRNRTQAVAYALRNGFIR